MRNKKVLLIVQAALIAAIYVVLTYFISAFNLASGAIQVRISREFDTLKSKKVPQSLEIGLFFCQIFIFII